VNLLDTTTLISPLEVPRTQPEPMTQPRLSKELVKAIYDFAGTDDEDLPFRRGEILEVIEKQEEKVIYGNIEINNEYFI
jgi:C-crk adapter molecule crk